MGRKRQGKGDYHGGSTVLSASGWGWSEGNPKRSKKSANDPPKKKRSKDGSSWYERTLRSIETEDRMRKKKLRIKRGGIISNA